MCNDVSAPAHGTIRGVLTWGYAYSEREVFTEDLPVAENRPSETWLDAAEAWNRARNYTIPGRREKWAGITLGAPTR